MSGECVSTKSKRMKRILEKPARSDITYSEMKEFLLDMGFKEIKNNGRSHRLFIHEKSNMPVNIQSKDGLIQKYQVIQIQNIVREITD